MKKYVLGIMMIAIMLICPGCEIHNPVADSIGMEEEMTYKMITMEEAAEIFKTAGDYIILDVRREDEFVGGHIPGAINIPNETIGDKEIPVLPNKDKVIYVYCRSGKRSKQAAAKLVQLGYTNIVEFGGILDWNGEVEE